MDVFSMFPTVAVQSKTDDLPRSTESTYATFYQPRNSYDIGTGSSRMSYALQSTSSVSEEARNPESTSPATSRASPLGLLYPFQLTSSTPTQSSSPPKLPSNISTPDKVGTNMDDSGNSSGCSPASSISSPSSDYDSSNSKSSPPVLSKSTSSPGECRLKKNTRTNYSPQQVRSLEKIFLVTPYLEPEVLEQLSRDLGIPEKNLKIWFQNKRARWRKQVQNNKCTFPPVYSGYPASVPSSVSPYSIMSPSSLMSPIVPSQVPSKPVYYLPSTLPLSQLYPSHFPSYVQPYVLPQY